MYGYRISEASGWPLGSQWVAYATSFVTSFISSGWLSQILLVLSILPVGGLRVASGWLSQILLLLSILPVGGFV